MKRIALNSANKGAMFRHVKPFYRGYFVVIHCVHTTVVYQIIEKGNHEIKGKYGGWELDFSLLTSQFLLTSQLLLFLGP